MITDVLSQASLYESLSPRFAAAFEFLRAAGPDLPDGRHDIDGDQCFAIVQTYETKPLEQARFEAHQRYTDIQFVLSGAESILCAPVSTLPHETEPYVADRDIAFFAHPPAWTTLHLAAGDFAIFLPHDGHAPCIAIGAAARVRKVVIKVEA